jgi:hypothetical protein
LYDAPLSEKRKNGFSERGSTAGVAGVELNGSESGVLEDTEGESGLSDSGWSEKKHGRFITFLYPF